MSAALVAAMEDVLAVYAEPYDPRRPQVNLDATSTPWVQEPRPLQPAQPGQPPRDDDESERNGTRHLLLCVEPQAGWRHVQVTGHRTALDFAYAMPGLVDEGDPEAEGIRVVLDTLKTQKSASLDEAFTSTAARRIARKLECHDTPKHGRWLHMAAIA